MYFYRKDCTQFLGKHFKTPFCWRVTLIMSIMSIMSEIVRMSAIRKESCGIRDPVLEMVRSRFFSVMSYSDSSLVRIRITRSEIHRIVLAIELFSIFVNQSIWELSTFFWLKEYHQQILNTKTFDKNALNFSKE